MTKGYSRPAIVYPRLGNVSRRFAPHRDNDPMCGPRLTAFVERAGSGHVCLCPELDIASQVDMSEPTEEG